MTCDNEHFALKKDKENNTKFMDIYFKKSDLKFPFIELGLDLYVYKTIATTVLQYFYMINKRCPSLNSHLNSDVHTASF